MGVQAEEVRRSRPMLKRVLSLPSLSPISKTLLDRSSPLVFTIVVICGLHTYIESITAWWAHHIPSHLYTCAILCWSRETIRMINSPFPPTFDLELYKNSYHVNNYCTVQCSGVEDTHGITAHRICVGGLLSAQPQVKT